MEGTAKGDNLGDKQPQNGASKKPRQNGKPNHTVPRPFVLATEKRITRERRGSMDLNEPKQKLSKSVSFNSSAKRSVSTPVSSKENQGEASEKSSAFKALPLPGFYHKKNSQNKVSLTQQTSVPVKSAEDKVKKVPASKMISNKAKETNIGRQILKKSTQKIVVPAKLNTNAVAAIA